MSTITLSVTPEDILKGEASDCARCPIARALARRFPGKEVEVYGFGAFVYQGFDSEGFQEHYKDFELDDRAKAFIRAFDEGEPVKPSRFVLTEVPVSA